MKLLERIAAGGCFVIAEAGSNHDGKLEQAKRLIDIAADAGADAVKFQLFKAARLYAKGAGKSDYLKSEVSIYDIIEKMEMPFAWLPDLKAHCDARGIEFMASAFDEASLDHLDAFVSTHKCASYELTHHPLLERMAAKQKPLLLSTGAANMEEIGEAVKVVAKTGNRRLFLLQCTASYPAPIGQSNVRALVTLREAFGVPAGLSDHSSEPLTAPTAAVALGAVVVEKHFTISRTLPGPDHKFAIEPGELAAMVAAIHATSAALGDGKKVPLPAEEELRTFARRSIFTLRAIRAGERFDESNLAVLRAGKLTPGLAPSAWPRVLGKKAARDVAAETGLADADVGE